MTLEDQVVSLELAELLKEAGYPQESIFAWRHHPKGHWYLIFLPDKFIYDVELISAPTGAELGEQLPQVIKDKEEWPIGFCQFKVDSTVSKNLKKIWKVTYQDLVIQEDIIGFQDESEENARAKMWLYLKKEGLL